MKSSMSADIFDSASATAVRTSVSGVIAWDRLAFSLIAGRPGHRAAILRFQGVNFGSTNAKRDIPLYAELYLQGRMNLDDLVSKRISLREVDDAYAALKDGSLTRVVVTSF